MSFLNKKVDFPQPFIILFMTLLVCLLIIGFGFKETKYTFNRFYLSISQSANVSNEIAALRKDKDQSVKEIKVNRPPGQLEADLVTFAIWGVIGLVVFTIGRLLYKSFIYPFYHDSEEANFVHANKGDLFIKRFIWVSSIIVTILVLVFTIIVFKSVVLPYYSIMTYAPARDDGLVLAGAIAIMVALISVLRLGVRIITRTY